MPCPPRQAALPSLDPYLLISHVSDTHRPATPHLHVRLHALNHSLREDPRLEASGTACQGTRSRPWPIQPSVPSKLRRVSDVATLLDNTRHPAQGVLPSPRYASHQDHQAGLGPSWVHHGADDRRRTCTSRASRFWRMGRMEDGSLRSILDGQGHGHGPQPAGRQEEPDNVRRGREASY